ncbi:B3 domain-containing protein Os01g0234100-like [Mercurialis annua]|uniref:B3 domain-containing protein Os01g0234100-like n=1 Tax=Mercurialis annua TaxID=3986 RepID=UPI00215F745F|nr:B3 domain-containing protein Os01g0234100-like [Mercurialis annua]
MTVVQPKKLQELTKRARPRKMVKDKLLSITYKPVSCKNPVKSESDKCKRETNESIYDNDGLRNYVMQRAKEVQANLPPQFPSLIKYMLPSHVTGCFWMGLPRKFCDEHMPIRDTMMELEDENGVCSEAKYLTAKVGLSGGWRGFSIAHKLVQGDVVVFQLVRPAKFKVYIVRVKGSEEVDVALGLLQLEGCLKEASPVQSENAVATIEYLKAEPVSTCSLELDNQKNAMMDAGTDIGSTSEYYEDESYGLGSGLLDGIRLSESAIDFKEVKSFEDFNILNNGLVINPELSKYLQYKYYNLCCSTKSFLHEHLLEGLNLKLAAGVMAETINIADAIRASKLTTPLDSFITWKNTLEAFKKLGMNVDFLIERLDQLMKLADKPRRYKVLTDRKLSAEERRRTLETQLLEIEEETNRIDIELQQLGENRENHELMFREVVEAPW